MARPSLPMASARTPRRAGYCATARQVKGKYTRCTWVPSPLAGEGQDGGQRSTIRHPLLGSPPLRGRTIKEQANRLNRIGNQPVAPTNLTPHSSLTETMITSGDKVDVRGMRSAHDRSGRLQDWR